MKKGGEKHFLKKPDLMLSQENGYNFLLCSQAFSAFRKFQNEKFSEISYFIEMVATGNFIERHLAPNSFPIVFNRFFQWN